MRVSCITTRIAPLGTRGSRRRFCTVFSKKIKVNEELGSLNCVLKYFSYSVISEGIGGSFNSIKNAVDSQEFFRTFLEN